MRFSEIVTCAALFYCVRAVVKSVKLQKISPGKRLDYNGLQRHGSVLHRRYATDPQQPLLANPSPNAPFHPNGRHEIPLEHLLDSPYFTEIQVGPSHEPFNVIVDTATAGLVLFTPPQDEQEPSTAPRTHTPPSPPFNALDPDLRARQATVYLSDLVLQNQTLVPILWPFIRNISGILGLAPSAVGVNGTLPPLQNMLKQGLLDAAMFGVYLSRLDDSARDSTLTLGGLDEESFVGEMVWLPARREGSWEVEIEAVSLGGREVEVDGAGAVADTGSTFLLMPSSLAEVLNVEIGAENSPDGFKHVDCGRRAELPEIGFKLAGHEFTITADDYVLDVGDGVCISAILGFDLPSSVLPQFILGDPFLRRWYSAYDLEKGRVGLARAA